MLVLNLNFYKINLVGERMKLKFKYREFDVKKSESRVTLNPTLKVKNQTG